MKNCFKVLLLLFAMIMLCCCADDNDDTTGKVIYAWEESEPIVAQEYYGVWDSMIILRSRSDIETEINTSRIESEAYRKITNVDFNKYDVVLCWTNNEYHDFVSVEEIENFIIIRTKKRKEPHYAMPYMYYTAVRINKTNLPDESIKYFCEEVE